MLHYLWLLLPVAALSGWLAARARYRGRRATERKEPRSPFLSSRYIRGLNYLLNEQQDKAIEVFIEMVEVDSETVETHIVLGNLFRRRGEVDRAIRIHQNLIARPNLSLDQRRQALLELGKDYMRAGLLDRAESVFHELVEDGIRQEEPYRLLREIYEQEKEWQRAIEVCRQQQKIGDRDLSLLMAHYHCELGEQELAQGALASAMEHARTARGLCAACVRGLLLLAEVVRARGDSGRSMKLLRTAAVEHPDMLPVLLPPIIEGFQRENDPAALEDWLRSLLEARPRPSVMLALINLLEQQGRRQEARALVEEGLEQGRMSAEVMRRYAGLLAEEYSRDDTSPIPVLSTALARLEETRPAVQCRQCGFQATKLSWQCPGCHGWDTMRPLDEWQNLKESESHEP
ncbi:MAG: lipopolysaccharide assembly protein LapB [Gammaproteobacteria bacterium]|nr:MAG: lipopolysaccharide assembly protein LapB [Gammaproteobacteria bacterium]